MNLFKQAAAFAKSPKAKQLLRQARRLDTPTNRRKAKDVVSRLRGQKKRGDA